MAEPEAVEPEAGAVAEPEESVLPRGTVTFLFTDLEGSTKLLGAYPEAYPRALLRHDAILRQAVEAHHGVVFETVGDAFYAAFARPAEAVAAALAAQQALHAEPWEALGLPPQALRARMGLHTGAVEVRGRHYFGPALYRCARLMATGHGTQTLLSGTTAGLVRDALPAGATLRDLGSHRLKDLAEPEPVWQVAHPSLPAEFPPLRSLDLHPNNLPAQTTRFIGRQAAVAAVRALLGGEPGGGEPGAEPDSGLQPVGARLVTLVGPGGAGKTRLALEVAAEQLTRYPYGVWLVELAPLRDPALVPQAIAGVLKVREAPHEPLETTLVAFLREQRLLLVLDNCEHLVETCARLADTLLRGCPGVSLLATSREALNVSGEAVWRVGSLSLPRPEEHPAPAPGPHAADGLGADAVVASEAGRLFVERAVAAQPSFALTDRNAAAVAEVCRRLDGIPLALELAAARVRLLGVEQLAERLGDRFRLLTGGSRTSLPRQQTLRALVDWSHDLLPDAERTLFRRLAVFAGSFSLEAAEAVCAGDGLEDWEVLDLLGRLVDKSLVSVVEQEEGARYFLLETLRQYAAERLAGAGEAASLSARHAGWCLAFVQAASPHLTGPEQVGWLDRVEREMDNLRLALQWSLDAEPTAETALRMGRALMYYWLPRGPHGEARRWLAAALAVAGDQAPPEVRCDALYTAGALAYQQADMRAVLGLAEPCLAQARLTRDSRRVARAFQLMGLAQSHHRAYPVAEAAFTEALALNRSLADQRAVAITLQNLSILEEDLRRFELALAHKEEAVAILRQLGAPVALASTLNSLGVLQQTLGNDARAEEHYREALALARQAGDGKVVRLTMCNLGDVAQRRGDPETAGRLLRQALAAAHQVGDHGVVACCLDSLAGVAVDQRQYALALTVLAASDALRDVYAMHRLVPEGERYQGWVAAARSHLSEADAEAAWTTGASLDLQAAIALVAAPPAAAPAPPAPIEPTRAGAGG